MESLSIFQTYFQKTFDVNLPLNFRLADALICPITPLIDYEVEVVRLPQKVLDMKP